MDGRHGVKPFASLPGKIVLMGTSADHLDLFAVYEQPRAWWQFWRSEFGVKRFKGEEIA